VAAIGVNVDAGGPGGRITGRGAKVDAVVRRQRARQLPTGIVAERADEGRPGTGACAGGRLVETLAARAGAVLSAERLARARQRCRRPDVVDVERPDDDDAVHAIVSPSITVP